ANGIEVAGAHDGLLAAYLDARELPGERRAHEGGVLPGSRLIERPGADDVEAVRAAPLRGRQIRRRLARAVDGERTEWSVLGDRLLGGGDRAVDLGRGDGEHARPRRAEAHGVEDGERAAEVRPVGRLGVALRGGREREAGEVEHGVGPAFGEQRTEALA